uniref:NADH-ubiquinone oxidoreductase chain 6 n=1 Tax=Mazarredia convexa TaxID=1634147 RepID=A0A7G7WR06_9ORTH|nr:NADH dehydrogenase subunit 6 [Mazarredia convexa]
MKLIMLLASILNIMFINTKQPMILIMIILIQTLLTTFMMNNYNKSSWFNYILMIIFIGGMMVLFIYITSIAPNEKNYSYKKMFTMTAMTMTILWVLENKNNPESTETSINPPFEMSKEQMDTNMMFNYPLYQLTIMMTIYLFITLIVVNKISNMEKGPLRINHN